jgi:hypothetical protein
LAFQDVELSSERQDIGPAPIGACSVEEDGRYQCVARSLRECQGDLWKEIATCNADQYCSVEFGACLACEPGEQKCDGELLQVCNTQGTGHEALQDCALTDQVCDSRVEACVDCRSGDSRCESEDRVLGCSGGEFTRPVTCDTNFAVGCIPTEGGRDDYCSDCRIVGELNCGPDQDLRECGADFKWRTQKNCMTCELISQMEANCVQ